jgi:hypothetical protein
MLADLVCLWLARHTPDPGGFGSLESNAAFDVAWLGFPFVGALIASRHPRNPIGWLFCAGGLLMEFGQLAWGYGFYALLTRGGALPAGETMAWIATWAYVPAFALNASLLLQLFPNGRLVSPRWRWVFDFAIAANLLLTFGIAFGPGALDQPFESVANPYAIAAIGTWPEQVGWVLTALSLLAAAGSLIARLVRSHGAERFQLKWVAYPGALGALTFGAAAATFQTHTIAENVVATVAPLVSIAFPVSVGIAILRYRLFDIDLIINRTLVYAALSASLGLIYAGSVVTLQYLSRSLTRGSDLAIAASTLAVAALFSPARARIQAVVDRRFYRQRYDAAQALAAFSSRLRDEIDLDTLTGELQTVIQQTIQPAQVSIWLKPLPERAGREVPDLERSVTLARRSTPAQQPAD